MNGRVQHRKHKLSANISTLAANWLNYSPKYLMYAAVEFQFCDTGDSVPKAHASAMLSDYR